MSADIDHSHDPDAHSWVEGADQHPDFPVQNLPLGLFSPEGADPRLGTAIGDYGLDLRAVAPHLPEPLRQALVEPSLNRLLSHQARDRLALRHILFELLTHERHKADLLPHLYRLDGVQMHVPAQIGDYTDFYVGIHHAANIGAQFRPDNPLLPNYKYVPIGYHGRASSIRVSGHPVVRPQGQIKSPDNEIPVLGPSARLDFELELGVWISGENALGEQVSLEAAPSRIAGLCLLNDWSARDLQAWEYQPLGPFLAKNFLTTISPWIVTMEALAPFRTAQRPRPEGDPLPLPYLWNDQDQSQGALSVDLEVLISTQQMRQSGAKPERLSHSHSQHMYWTIAQMVAHHTASGCNLMPGDLLGTGTLSGPTPGSEGSLTEISLGGQRPLALANGQLRSFLEDGDELILRASAAAQGWRTIGFGDCRGQIVSATTLLSTEGA